MPQFKSPFPQPPSEGQPSNQLQWHPSGYQPPLLPPQQPYMQPGTYQQPPLTPTIQSMPAPQPPPQPSSQPPRNKRRARKEIIVAVSILLAVLVVLGTIGVFAYSSSSKSTTGTAAQTKQAPTASPLPTATPTPFILLTDTPTPEPTVAPTPIPTSTPTSSQVVQPSDSAILGADISAFIATYGQPSNTSGDSYTFSSANLDITTFDSRALAILDSASGQWSTSEARAACLALSPSDAQYQRSMTLLDPSGQPMAIQFVYYSASLSNVFPASEFTDENGNPDKPGTFGIVLTYVSGDISQVVSCSTQVGLQQK